MPMLFQALWPLRHFLRMLDIVRFLFSYFVCYKAPGQFLWVRFCLHEDGNSRPLICVIVSVTRDESSFLQLFHLCERFVYYFLYVCSDSHIRDLPVRGIRVNAVRKEHVVHTEFRISPRKCSGKAGVAKTGR